MQTFLMNLVKSTGLLVLGGLLVIGVRTANAAFTTPVVQDPTFAEFGWNQAFCDKMGNAGGASAASNLCGSFAFVQSTAGTYDSVGNAGGYVYDRLKEPGSAGAGAMFSAITGTSGIGWMTAATSTPVIESVVRIDTPQNSTTTSYYIGLMDTINSGTFSVIGPGQGCYMVASSTLRNWMLVSNKGTATTTVDTGIASTTNITGTGGWYKFRISLTGSSCSLSVQISTTTPLYATSSISTNLPTAPLNPVLYFTQTSAGLSNAFDFMHTHVWWKDVLPPL